MSLRRGLAFVAALLCVTLVACEVGVSTYFYWVGKSVTTTFFEDPGVPLLRFDPRIGYRFCDRPFKKLLLGDRKLEYLSNPKGNKLGFIDQETPSVKRQDKTTFRVAVLGDSFTCASFLDRNWPDRVERLGHQSGFAVEMLNFAQDGAGIANWALIVDKLLLGDNYEIDAILFAIFEDDLTRRLMMIDTAADGSILLAHSDSWRPESYPRSREEALKLLSRGPARVVSPNAFERIASRKRPPFRPILFDAARLLAPALLTPAKQQEDDLHSPDRLALINDMAASITAKRWPCLVVIIPRNPRQVPPARLVGIEYFYAEPILRDMRNLAQTLNASTLDGSGMHAGLKQNEVEALWFATDGHWNQQGSDRFADFILPYLSEWLRSR